MPFGCFPAGVLRELGGWRDDLAANEDFELNHRLRAHGYRVVFDPAIRAIYRPRESLGDIACQYWRYGRWKAEVLLAEPRALRARQIAPPLLLAAAAAAPFARPPRLLLVAYGLVLAGAGARPGAGPRTAAVLATMHLCWGAGLVAGLAKAVRPRKAAPG